MSFGNRFCCLWWWWQTTVPWNYREGILRNWQRSRCHRTTVVEFFSFWLSIPDVPLLGPRSVDMRISVKMIISSISEWLWSGWGRRKVRVWKSVIRLSILSECIDRVMDGIKLKSRKWYGSDLVTYNMGYGKNSADVLLLTFLIVGRKSWHLYIRIFCVTHKHLDHYNNDLIQRSVWFIGKRCYPTIWKTRHILIPAKGDKDYEIGKFKIKNLYHWP